MNTISRNAYALPKSEPKIAHRNECDNNTRVRLMILLRQSRVPLEGIAIFTERLLGKFHERIVGLSDTSLTLRASSWQYILMFGRRIPAFSLVVGRLGGWEFC